MKTYKNIRDGWLTESTYDLKHKGSEGDYVIKLTTTKRYNGNLVTTASVVQATEFGFMCLPFTDYNKTLVSEKVSRVTAKTCEEQHKKALELLPVILPDINKQYNIGA